MKIKDHYTREQVELIHKRIDEFFESDSGYLIISSGDKNEKPKITDLYSRVCGHCILKQVHFMVRDASKLGLLAMPDPIDHA